MAQREPVTQVVNVTEARQRRSQLLARVLRRETQVIVEKSGIPVAAIIAPEDLERFKRLEAQRAERFRILDRFAEAFKHETTEESERLSSRR